MNRQGAKNLDGKALLTFSLWPPRFGDSWRQRKPYSVVEESKRGTSQSEVPLFVWIGSPGRTRTCDQPVTSAPIFQPGLDYLFTRLQEHTGEGVGRY